MTPDATLENAIELLESEPDKDRIVPFGFGSPHSYRGYYEDLAFEPMANVTVGEMLDAAKSAVGATFDGYKGGEFKMSMWSTVWLADYGCCGETLGPTLLRFMLKAEAAP